MITHDICQPWEVKLARLKKRLEEAEEVVEFYASRRSYSMDDYQGISGEMRTFCILYGDSEEINDVTSYAGRRAREYLEKLKQQAGDP